MNPQVSIIMGSTSDMSIMEEAAKLLNELQIPFEINALSAHRVPELVMVNVAYEYDATKSLFVHKMTEESLFSEVNYILSVSEFLEILEYKKPSLILIHTSLEEMLALAKLSSWLKEHGKVL